MSGYGSDNETYDRADATEVAKRTVRELRAKGNGITQDEAEQLTRLIAYYNIVGGRRKRRTRRSSRKRRTRRSSRRRRGSRKRRH